MTSKSVAVGCPGIQPGADMPGRSGGGEKVGPELEWGSYGVTFRKSGNSGSNISDASRSNFHEIGVFKKFIKICLIQVFQVGLYTISVTPWLFAFSFITKHSIAVNFEATVALWRQDRATVILRKVLAGLLMCTAVVGCSKQSNGAGTRHAKTFDEEATPMIRAGFEAQSRHSAFAAPAQTEPVDGSTAASRHLLDRARSTPDDDAAVEHRERANAELLVKDERFVHELSRALSYALSHTDSVLSARIHIVLPDEDQPGGNHAAPSATVIIKYRPDTLLDTLQPEIRRAIIERLPNVAPERISFIFMSGATPPALQRIAMLQRQNVGLKIANDSDSPPPWTEVSTLLLGAVCVVVAGLQLWQGRRSIEPTVKEPVEATT